MPFIIVCFQSDTELSECHNKLKVLEVSLSTEKKTLEEVEEKVSGCEERLIIEKQHVNDLKQKLQDQENEKVRTDF